MSKRSTSTHEFFSVKPYDVTGSQSQLVTFSACSRRSCRRRDTLVIPLLFEADSFGRVAIQHRDIHMSVSVDTSTKKPSCDFRSFFPGFASLKRLAVATEQMLCNSQLIPQAVVIIRPGLCVFQRICYPSF
ncbi:hypothetical protein K503DRAFT_589880 [Rhizopogon vinicolor AM-OR11-026]|uniref:Uncharacterized protein n=1 Tax=Rhizopogon vinicolor AM-OR11-026 TaxID=1314800 RepID=A0A1B7MJB0_9AGAM|nr:hypothetical protein K503DRAFT_589880 [Rhizopogon vinicolor AM-OR11-026]